MDGIKTFTIEVDISDRSLLYDYAKEEYVQQPAGGWDYNELKARADDYFLNAVDENQARRVVMMDKAIADKRRREKTKENDKDGKESDSGIEWGIMNKLEPSQNLPRRLLPVYEPGEIVKGTLTLETTEPIEAEALKLEFKGRAGVQIRVYSQHGYYDFHKEEVYTEGENMIWEKSDMDSDVNSDFSKLTLDHVEKSQFIPPGTHRFPFEFAIDIGSRNSCPTLIDSNHDFAYVMYRLKAIIDKGKMFARGNVLTHKAIWVQKPYDIALLAENLAPVHDEETLETGFFSKSGMITLRADLPRKAYVRNEIVPCMLEIDNNNENEILQVTACIILHGKTRCGTGRCSAGRSVHIKTNKMAKGPIPGKSVQNIKFDLPLDFSETHIDNNLIPAGTLEDIAVIDVQYELVVELKRKRLARDMEMKIPITVGTINSKAQKSGQSLYPEL